MVEKFLQGVEMNLQGKCNNFRGVFDTCLLPNRGLDVYWTAEILTHLV